MGADRAIAGIPPIWGIGGAEFDCEPGRLAMPDFACDLIWCGGKLLVVGPMTKGQVMNTVHGRMSLVSLGPIQARQLLGCPLSDLTDRIVPVDAVVPGIAAPLVDLFAMGQSGRLLQRPAPSLRTASLQDHDNRLRVALQAFSSGAAPERVASMLAVSTRHLRRLVREALGLSPGEFVRILRFRRAIASARRGVALVYSSHDAGYVDQAHFNREARRLTGLTPRQGLASLGGGGEVVPLERDD